MKLINQECELCQATLITAHLLAVLSLLAHMFSNQHHYGLPVWLDFNNTTPHHLYQSTEWFETH